MLPLLTLLPQPPAARAALQEALVAAGDAVPEGLQVELPASLVGVGAALATVLERSRR